MHGFNSRYFRHPTYVHSGPAPVVRQMRPTAASLVHAAVSQEAEVDGGERTLTVTTATGQHSYLQRRFLPQGSLLPVQRDVTVVDGDRLDLIAYRTLGAADQGWRICDANNALYPPDLLVRGRSLQIPIPEPDDPMAFADGEEEGASWP